jgi:hypothetical protein
MKFCKETTFFVVYKWDIRHVNSKKQRISWNVMQLYWFCKENVMYLNYVACLGHLWMSEFCHSMLHVWRRNLELWHLLLWIDLNSGRESSATCMNTNQLHGLKFSTNVRDAQLVLVEPNLWSITWNRRWLPEQPAKRRPVADEGCVRGGIAVLFSRTAACWVAEKLGLDAFSSMPVHHGAMSVKSYVDQIFTG